VPAAVESYAPPAPTNAQQFQDGIARVRAAGYSWDDIGAQLAPKFEAARNAGFTPTEIAKNLGFSDPKPILQAVSNHIEDGADAADIRKQYAHGITSQRLTDATKFFDQALHLPTDVLSGAYQGAKQGINEAIEATKANPGESWAETMGRVLQRDFSVALGATTGAAAGGATVIGGPQFGRDIGAMVEQGGGLLGSPHAAPKFPTANELTDNALALQLGTTGKVADGATKPIVDNLVTGWAKTGEDPAATVQRAPRHAAASSRVDQFRRRGVVFAGSLARGLRRG
jgi:hypothetical protein